MIGPAKAEGSSAAASAASTVQEVVVTAQKRDERLLDVPVPVSVVSAQWLAQTNQFRLDDYYSSIPGLNLTEAERGSPSISIRGVTTGAFVTPTVGFVVDDAPFGSAVQATQFSPVPDIDPLELKDIEVLRGPQGTLYGA